MFFFVSRSRGLLRSASAVCLSLACSSQRYVAAGSRLGVVWHFWPKINARKVKRSDGRVTALRLPLRRASRCTCARVALLQLSRRFLLVSSPAS